MRLLLSGVVLPCALVQSVSFEWVPLSPASTLPFGPGSRNRPTIDVAGVGSNDFFFYSFGGVSGGRHMNDLWVYDSRTRDWTELCADSVAAPAVRFDALGGYLEADGGAFIIGSGEGIIRFFADVWACHLSSGQWIRLDADSRTSPEPRYGAAGGLVGGRFFLTHGFSVKRYSNTFSFDVAKALSDPSVSQEWKEEVSGVNLFDPFKPHARCLVGTTTFFPFVYMYGGCAHKGETGGPCPAHDVWRFDVVKGEWKRLKDGPVPVENSDVAFLSDGNRLALFGGSLAGDQVITNRPTRRASDLHILDVEKDEWKSYTSVTPSSWIDGNSVNMQRMVETLSLNISAAGGRSVELLMFGGRNQNLGGRIYGLVETKGGKDTARDGWYYFSMVYLHGIFMFAGWGVFLQFGAFAFRYFKHHQSKWAWMAHRGAQSFGLLLAIVGFVLAFRTGGDLKFSHARIGIAVMVLGLLNPVIALFRCHPGDEKNVLRCGFDKRWVFNLLHHMIGRAALVLALLNIALGISMSQAPIGWWIAFMVWLGVIVLAYLVCEVLRLCGVLPRIPRTPAEQYLCGLGDAKVEDKPEPPASDEATAA